MEDPIDTHPRATRSRRFLAGMFLAALSGITGVISYNHGLDVVRLVGNTGLVAYLVPLVPDLMIVTSSLTLIEASALRVARPPMAMLALVAGIGWTVAMNVAAGWRHGPGGALIAAGVPLAFVLTFESLLWLARRGRGGSVAAAAPATSSQGEPPEPPSTEEALRVLLATGSRRGLADVLGVPKSRVDSWAASLRQVAEVAEPDGIRTRSLRSQGGPTAAASATRTAPDSNSATGPATVSMVAAQSANGSDPHE